MIKILNMVIFSLIMIADITVTLFAHLLGYVFLMCNEMVGSKKFKTVFIKNTRSLFISIKITLKDYKELVAKSLR